MSDNREIILVTGPSRSGKSEWAEHLAAQKNTEVTYLATGFNDPNDSEWSLRIQKHQERRSSGWQTREEMYNLSSIIAKSSPPHCLLIDSLGTWVANLLQEEEQDWQNRVEEFLATLDQSSVDVILVAEETGWGVVPAYPLGRSFRDRLGDLIRRVSPLTDFVYLVTGGYVLTLNELGQPLPPKLS